MVSESDSVVRTIGLTKIYHDFWYEFTQFNQMVTRFLGLGTLSTLFRDFSRRRQVVAVEDLDLDIAPRQVFGLLGPNGSGKTTTLKMLLSLLFPTRGKILLFGKHPSRKEVRARVGFLPEESHFYSFLDARETLDYYGKLFGLPRRLRKRRIETLLEMVGLRSAAFRRLGGYSKGMQRRIGLAQALINDPDLLILDEPTTGLDPMGTKLFKDLIQTLAERGKTVILSSHLLADVEDVCDRLCILYGGKKQTEGTKDKLLSVEKQTQIVTDQIDAPLLKKVEELLESEGKQIHSVSHPRDRLESLFMRIVEEAGKRRETTGAISTSGGQIAGFLRGEEEEQGDDFIETLVSKGQGRTDAEEMKVSDTVKTLSPDDANVDRDVIGELTSTPEEEKHDLGIEVVADDAGTSSSYDSDSAREADRGLIDGLITRDHTGQDQEGESNG